MHLATCRTDRSFILYEAEGLCDAPTTPPTDPGLFDPDYWRHSGRVIDEAPGRGASLFLDVGKAQWVLRPYRRGGLIARFSERRYLWTGLERTRAFREMRLTAELLERGLPVPRPLAAGVTCHGLTYEAALITVRIVGARALAELLLSGDADRALLERVGATVRRFHDASLDHVDLNARNLLVDPRGKVWLIDLDRCRRRRLGKWQDANLERLQRSLSKFDAAGAMPAIRHGYGAA